MKKKFHPDIKFLIFKYSAQLRAEMKEAEKLKEKLEETT